MNLYMFMLPVPFNKQLFRIIILKISKWANQHPAIVYILFAVDKKLQQIDRVCSGIEITAFAVLLNVGGIVFAFKTEFENGAINFDRHTDVIAVLFSA